MRSKHQHGAGRCSPCTQRVAVFTDPALHVHREKLQSTGLAQFQKGWLLKTSEAVALPEAVVSCQIQVMSCGGPVNIG